MTAGLERGKNVTEISLRPQLSPFRSRTGRIRRFDPWTGTSVSLSTFSHHRRRVVRSPSRTLATDTWGEAFCFAERRRVLVQGRRHQKTRALSAVRPELLSTAQRTNRKRVGTGVSLRWAGQGHSRPRRSFGDRYKTKRRGLSRPRRQNEVPQRPSAPRLPLLAEVSEGPLYR